MQTFTIRNQADAWRVWSQFERNGSIPKLRFDGWPRLTISSDKRLDGVRTARAIGALQDATERLLAVLKYGQPNRRRLTTFDKVAARLDVYHLDGGRRVEVDMTNAANAAAQAVEALESSNHSQGSLLAPESWERTAREVGLALPKQDLKSVLKIAIVAAGLAWTSAAVIKEGFAHLTKSLEIASAHQLKMAELDRTMLIVEPGRTPVYSKAVDDALKLEQDHARKLISSEVEHPLVKFVVATVEDTRPALLTIAAMSSTINFNGLSLPSSTATAIAKTARKSNPSGWTTTVQRARTIES